ncbi:MAG: F0F1 ATP synthase subunit alpha, partial [Actinomycetaceae bacterium]|nr:F0F1 ATP synthase subunit alpha [Actinomycetaceae bacterium]
IPVEKVLDYEKGLLSHVRHNTSVMDTLASTGNFDDDALEALKSATEDFTEQFRAAEGITGDDEEFEAEDAQEQIVAKRG